jgi:hypothetical protein
LGDLQDRQRTPGSGNQFQGIGQNLVRLVFEDRGNLGLESGTVFGKPTQRFLLFSEKNNGNALILGLFDGFQGKLHGFLNSTEFDMISKNTLKIQLNLLGVQFAFVKNGVGISRLGYEKNDKSSICLFYLSIIDKLGMG